MYGLSEVAEITGIEKHSVSYYANRGIVVPDLRGSVGTGNSRVYSKRNLFQFFLLKELIDCGVPLKKIGELLVQLGYGIVWSESTGDAGSVWLVVEDQAREESRIFLRIKGNESASGMANSNAKTRLIIDVTQHYNFVNELER